MMAASVVLLVGCQQLGEEEEVTESPTAPAAVPSSTVSAITIPVILPASNPTPTPAPQPTPTPDGGGSPFPGPAPSPTPEPAPPPPPTGGGGGCNVPPQSPQYSCQRTGGAFLGDVTTAIKRVINNRPGLFNKNDSICDICFKIKDHAAYTDAVVAEVHKMGYCAFYDGEELAIKVNNDFSEQYDISTSSGYIRTGEGSYRATCWPAWF
jgi:hypothetical protein